MEIFIKQIFHSSSHFLRIRSKYIPRQPTLKYLQLLFVRQHRRSSFTPISNIRGNNSSLNKRSTKQCVEYTYLLMETKTDVQKSTSSNCNSIFSVFSVFKSQTVRQVRMNLAIFSVHLREMHYVFQESITSAILQHFISITCQ